MAVAGILFLPFAYIVMDAGLPPVIAGALYLILIYWAIKLMGMWLLRQPQARQPRR